MTFWGYSEVILRLFWSFSGFFCYSRVFWGYSGVLLGFFLGLYDIIPLELEFF